MKPVRRTFVAVPVSAASARSAVSTFATACGFTGGSLSDIETSVGEAVANAIEHGNQMRGSFTLECSFTDGVLRIQVSDGGAGFSEASRPPVEIAPVRRTPSLRGYGIYLMRKLMHRVSYSDGGRTVVLEKQLEAVTEQTETGETG